MADCGLVRETNLRSLAATPTLHALYVPVTLATAGGHQFFSDGASYDATVVTSAMQDWHKDDEEPPAWERMSVTKIDLTNRALL